MLSALARRTKAPIFTCLVALSMAILGMQSAFSIPSTTYNPRIYAIADYDLVGEVRILREYQTDYDMHFGEPKETGSRENYELVFDTNGRLVRKTEYTEQYNFTTSYSYDRNGLLALVEWESSYGLRSVREYTYANEKIVSYTSIGVPLPYVSSLGQALRKRLENG